MLVSRWMQSPPPRQIVLDPKLIAAASEGVAVPPLPQQVVPAVPSAGPAADSCVPTLPPLEAGVIGFNRKLIGGMKGALDAMYAGRDMPRFYVLETIARVPYFSYLSCLHLYESLGARGKVHRTRPHQHQRGGG